jgi:hypothetical protein
MTRSRGRDNTAGPTARSPSANPIILALSTINSRGGMGSSGVEEWRDVADLFSESIGGVAAELKGC